MVNKNTPKQAEKTSADCPHCGFTQLESPWAKSTFCRKCGQHYSIEKVLAKEATSLKGPGFFDKLSKLVSRQSIREIACFSCHHKQHVSSAAQSSLCPQCGSYIDLRDFKIAGPFGRTIQTQGAVDIHAKGDASSARIGCHTAHIEGKLRGTLVATHDVFLNTKEKVLGAIEAKRLVVEKRCKTEVMRTVRVQTAEINGHLSARLYCDGAVQINKGGTLEGTLYAKAIVVEKGGIFSGELFIGQKGPDSETAEQQSLFGDEGLQLKPA